MASKTAENPTLEIPKGARELPAIFTNIFNIAAGPFYARVSFGEIASPGADPHYHTAIALSIADVKLLADSLVNILKAAEEAQKRSIT